MNLRRCLWLLLGMFWIGMPLLAQEATPEVTAPPAPVNDTIQIDLQQPPDSALYPTIKIYFSAYNSATGRVLRPPQDALTVTLDGQSGSATMQLLEEISDVDRPVDLMFVFDLTSSVAPNYMEQQRSTAQIIMDGLDENDLVGGVTFDSYAAQVVQVPDINHETMRDIINGLAIVQGPSNRFLDGLYLALETLNGVDAAGARRIVVVLTDVSDPQGEHTPDEIIQLANNLTNNIGAPLYFVGFGDDVNADVLHSFADPTRGFVYLEREADGGDLDRLAGDVADVIATEFRATFRANAPTDNGASARLLFMIDAGGITGRAETSLIKEPHELLVSLPNLQDGETVSGIVNFEPQVTYADPAMAAPARIDAEYYVQDILNYSASSPDISWRQWDTAGLPGGMYNIRVNVQDEVGNSAATAINLRITSPVTVTITAPALTETGAPPSFVPGVISIQADILSDVGVAEAVLSVDGEEIGGPVSTTPNYLFEWDATDKRWEGKTHTIEVRATDMQGAVAFAQVDVYVQFKEIDPLLIVGLIAGPIGLLALILLLVLRRRRHKRAKQSPAALFADMPAPTPSALFPPGMPSPVERTAIGTEALGGPVAYGPVGGAARSAILVGVQPQTIAGRQYPLNQPMIAIGRSKRENRYPFDDQTMSRHHSRILERGGIYYYVDLNTPNYNPSYINGQEVRGETQLRNGDRVKIGNTVFEFKQ